MDWRRRLALMASVALLAAACGWQDVSITVTFKDARGLRAGQAVVYNGVRAGDVTAVDLDATGRARAELRIARRYRDVLYLEADYAVAKPGGLLDLSGERQVTVSDRPGPRTPLRDGAVIEGREPLLDALADAARDAAAVVWQQLRDLSRRIADRIAAAEGGRELAEAMRRFEEAGAADPGQRERLGVIEAQADAVRQSLLRSGQPEAAQEFWRDFERWRDDARKACRAPNAR